MLSEALCDLARAPGQMQHRRRHAPGLARGTVAAGQAQRAQAAQTLELSACDDQQLATPGFAVGAEANAVERQAEHRARVEAAVLGQHRADVGVVVLHADRRHAQARGGGERDAGGVEVRMQVVGDGAHWPRGSREQGLHRRLDAGAGVRAVEVPEVGAEGPAVRVEQAGRVLEPGAEGEDGALGVGLGSRIAAGNGTRACTVTAAVGATVCGSGLARECRKIKHDFRGQGCSHGR